MLLVRQKETLTEELGARRALVCVCLCACLLCVCVYIDLTSSFDLEGGDDDFDY